MLEEAGRHTPDTVRELYTSTYREMQGAGFTVVGEFHYLGLETAFAVAEAAGGRDPARAVARRLRPGRAGSDAAALGRRVPRGRDRAPRRRSHGGPCAHRCGPAPPSGWSRSDGLRPPRSSCSMSTPTSSRVRSRSASPSTGAGRSSYSASAAASARRRRSSMRRTRTATSSISYSRRAPRSACARPPRRISETDSSPPSASGSARSRSVSARTRTSGSTRSRSSVSSRGSRAGSAPAKRHLTVERLLEIGAATARGTRARHLAARSVDLGSPLARRDPARGRARAALVVGCGGVIDADGGR